jgi:hypothetical protein
MCSFTLVNDIKKETIIFKHIDGLNILNDVNNLEEICINYNWNYQNDTFRLINKYGATMYIYIYDKKLNHGYWLNILTNLPKTYNLITVINNKKIDFISL